jgi:hypothetical protein
MGFKYIIENLLRISPRSKLKGNKENLCNSDRFFVTLGRDEALASFDKVVSLHVMRRSASAMGNTVRKG